MENSEAGKHKLKAEQEEEEAVTNEEDDETAPHTKLYTLC